MTFELREMEFTVILKPEQPVTLDTAIINAFAPLFGKARFKLRVVKK